jgi:hypothetical protein
MYRITLLLVSAVVISSCFLSKDFKKRKFTYTQDGQTRVLPIVVPKGYAKEQRTDTAGISLLTYTYEDGSVLYAAYLKDTAYELQSYNKAIHEPQVHRLGGLVYKGQDEYLRFYREIRQGNLRFGYRYVPSFNELEFDSATNYASLQKPVY